MRDKKSFGSRHRTRGVVAVGAAALSMLFAACTPDPAPPTTTTPADDAPSIIISDTSALAASGDTVTVTGENFDPAVIDGEPGSPVGIYVALGVGASDTYPEAFSAAKYIRLNGPVPETASVANLNSDGTFSATISPKALFAASGRAVNCYVDACSIYVFSAHTGSYAPWTFPKQAVTFQAPTSPMLAVSKTTGLNPAGEDVTVTGAGYLDAAPGVYAVFGPVDTNANWWLDASIFGDAEWVNNSAYGANGTFTRTLTVTGSYTGSAPVDCTTSAGACSIATMRAHGSTDRSQDVVVPLTFATTAAQ